MSATAEKLPTELAVLPPRETAVAVYSKANGLDPYLTRVREEIDGFTPDVSTVKGRKEIASIAFKVAKSKTALDNMGKDLVAELKDVPRKIDAERKRMRDLLDQWKDEVRQPLNEWEQAEAARIERHQCAIDEIDGYQATIDINGFNLPAYELKAALSSVEAIVINEEWEEFELQAARAKERTILSLKTSIESREKYEAEQAELAKLRAEAEERARLDHEREIAEKAKAEAEAAAKAREEEAERARQKREAEAAAQRERERLAEIAESERKEREYREQQQAAQAEAQRKEQEHAAAIARAEQEKQEAEQRAIDAASRERARIEGQQAAERAEAEKKAANKAHRKAINVAALEDIMAAGLVDESTAKALIALIATNKIRHVSINY